MQYKPGFIGLGNMGEPMAENILKKFGELVVFNRTRARCEAIAAMGAEVAESAGGLAEKCDLIFLSLPGPKEVTAVVAGPDGLLEHSHPGQIIVDFSTVAPLDSRNMAEAAEKKGVTYIDVPVSGGGVGAAKGALTLMIGAAEEEIRDAGLLPYLETVGNTFHYMNGRGNGSAIKIINNYMSFTAQVINGEALLMADHLGISMDDFYKVTTTSSGNNMILGAKMNKVKTGDLKPGFVIDLVMKDLELARQLCQDCQISNFTLNTGIQFYRLAQQLGYGQCDSSGVINVIRELEPAHND